MDLSQLPMHATLIAPTYMHGMLLKEMLENTQGVLGIQLVSLSSFFLRKQRSEAIEPLEVTLQYHRIMKQLPLQVYTSIALRYDFLSQCANFIQEMKFYNITCDQLPEHTPAQKEMKTILTALFPIRDAQDAQNEVLYDNQSSSFEHVYIYDYNYSEKEAKLREWLVARGAHVITLPNVLASKEFYYAINKRKEVESFAQLIIQKQIRAEDINVFVSDASYKPLIKQVFHRYHIPFTILKQSRASIITKRFLLLLQYYLKPSTSCLLELLDTNLFSILYIQDFLTYLEVFQRDINLPFDHVHTQAYTSELIDENEIERLKHLEDHAERCRQEMKPLLDQLMACDTMQALFEKVNELATLNIKRNQLEHVQTLKEIQSTIALMAPYVQTKEDLPFALDILEGIQEQASNAQLQGITICDLNASLPPRKLTCMLGCTQKAYPAFPAKKGLFDEAYVQLLPTYPSRKERYDHHMFTLAHRLVTSKELVVFYPVGGYDGKGNEAALEMDLFMEKRAMAYPIHENYQPLHQDNTISPQTAQQLFVKEQSISGSISAFERYQRCPFAYFLRYGLRVYEPIDVQFSQSRIGTLSHFILERLVTQYGKAYGQASKEEIEAILDTQLASMATLYPNFAPQVEIIKRRMSDSILKNIMYLKQMEEHSHIAPYKSEHEFWWDMKLDEEHQIKLHGFIDRIDASEGFYRIIDYKSSSKSLSETDVFAGLQLQLVTYALLTKKDFQKDALGAYYYSFKNENQSISYGKMKRRPVAFVEFGKEDYEAQWFASKKLKGWTMSEDVDVLDDDGTHIYGVRQNKDGEVVARKVYDIDILQEHFTSMYRSIGTSILNGNIACTPTDDACMFCPYGEICRFHGYPRVAQPLVEVDERIYKGGAQEDA